MGLWLLYIETGGIMRVSNGNVIKKLSFRSMRAARVRNRVAVTAIALTAVLFTALFTVALSFAYCFWVVFGRR